MRVLVAGDRGYIGAVLVPFLRAAGHEVDGLDLGLYEGCDLGPGARRTPAPRAAGDIRDVTAGQLAGYDAVICLAALSNDPLGDLNPAATYSVNLDGTLHLARAAKAGRRRALPVRLVVQPVRRGRLRTRWPRTRTCIPVTPYGETKVQAERDAVRAGRRQLQPDLPAQRHRVRRLAAAPPGHRGEQPHRGRDDDRARSGCKATGRRGGRWCTSRTSAGRSWPCSRRPRELVHDEAFNVGRARGQRAGPRHRRDGPRRGARLDGLARRRRRAGPAQLPGRLLQARPRPSPT